ncbi:MAG: hypothetical protein F4245_03935 [Cenarchaeum sp. SB0678_bin_8]|nr:hypothetical protein [Cenarchaeum sp. SB0666_bin_15]MYD58747.1 hypothetical protein [Cenarchaeum sp. SB0678_bin_8]
MAGIFKMPSPSNEEKSDYYREYASSINHKGPDPAPHQQAALTEMVEWYKQGKNLGGILVLSTGGGKSFVATRFLCRHPLSDGYRILWLAHTQYLPKQALEAFDKTIPQVDKTKMPIKVRVVLGAARHFNSRWKCDFRI